MNFWPFCKWTSSWHDGFKAGYLEAWREMSPIITDGIQAGRRVLEEVAIEQTMKRLSKNGRDKKAIWPFSWFCRHN